MSQKIDCTGLPEVGINASGEVMDNGELRIRCMHEDGSGYIRTEPPENQKPKWQNAHFHKGVRETYIVQKGLMAFASESPEGKMSIMLYEAGDVVTSVPYHQHNVYLYAGAVIHTVKHGEPVGNPQKGSTDWYPASHEFDAWTKRLSEADIRRLSSSLG